MQVLNSFDFANPKFANDHRQFLRARLTSQQSQQDQFSSRNVEKKGDGFQVFQSSLSRQYQSFSSQTVVPVSEPEQQKLSADAVANNILGFIEQRLRKEKAEGASEGELAARLEEGLAGFKKGFAEAKEQIEALGMLNPTVEEDINETYDLVLAGIDDLKSRFVDNKDDKADKSDGDTLTPKSKGGDIAASASFGQVSYAQSNSFNFEVETADGDIVTISAKSKDVYAAEYRAGSFSNGNRSGSFEEFTSQSYQSSRFDMSVVGELDEGELAALDQLMAKVEDLSADFFAGDLDSAFNQALNLGYDTDELVGYSLNLRQVEVQRVSVAYQQVGPGNTTAINPLADRMQPLGDFAQGLIDAIGLASPFAEPSRLIADLSEQIDIYTPPSDEPSTDSNRFGNFVKDILDALPAKTVANKSA